MTKLTEVTLKKPSLSVVICVHNAREYAELCIESVLRFTPAPYDLILVDDGSQQDTSEMLKAFEKEYEHISIIRHEQAKGYTCAGNAGLKASKSDYTVLLNSDTLVSKKWADKIIACGESHDSIGIIGPLSNAATYQSVPYVFDDNGRWKQNELPGHITVTTYAEAIGSVSQKLYPRVPVANGFCFAVKRGVIDAIGYLDEETFPKGYGEENDYCLRAADAGFNIAIADDAYVYHATSQSFGVKAREKLTKYAHHAIRSKYSEARLNEIDKALRNNSQMDKVRERIEKFVHHAQPVTFQRSRINMPKPHQDVHFLFLLPDCAAKAGGTQVVIETARGLHRMGANVSIAAKHSIKDEYDDFFPTDSQLFFYYKKQSELIEHAADYHVAIATIFHSVELMQTIIQHHPHIMPSYYVQDYEPYFLDERPDLKKQATESYTLIKNNHLFGISPWVCEVLQEKHGLKVEKITGSLDQDLFFPNYARDVTPHTLSISAMIRPNTPWRGPLMTMNTLKALKESFGDKINVSIFGCDDSQLVEYNMPRDFTYENLGILGRHDVASVLRESDIFLDLSEFQAFGRTALEAMACGAAVVAPQAGGVHDFGTHETNCLLTDTKDQQSCVSAASSLIESESLRRSLRENGIQTGLDYSIHRSTQSFLSLMYQLYAKHEQRNSKAA
ncbi:MAG: glycosyltransferase [Rickettsiales bacterium]|nr:glycosyltransferase [Rickettsiales bacterium]